MKVWVHPELFQRHMCCVMNAPSVFELSEIDGRAAAGRKGRG